MEILSFDALQRITGPIRVDSDRGRNAQSFLSGLNTFGAEAGLNKPHRLAFYLGQMLHESQGFQYDREIWGPTQAQARYDTRTDLGNTPERDGDGYLYRGRGPIQITGKANYRRFTKWARKIDHTAPDFEKDPDLINLDPWEGLGPIWYWSTRYLNKCADAGDIRAVTKAINGGYNGLSDRQRWTDRAHLVLAGFARDDVRAFQRSVTGLVVDGAQGPNTRAALFEHLVSLPPIEAAVPEFEPDLSGGSAVAFWSAIAGLAVGAAGAAVHLACRIPILTNIIKSCGG